MDLNTVWFILIAVLYIGFFILEGFDFGVGMLLPFLGRGENPEETDLKRRVIINTIGPFWDGNEVWLLTASGATFAAFPLWYATMFSGFYLPFLFLLVALIMRGIAIEFRSKDENPKWRKLWDWSIFAGSLFSALLLGIAFANLARGVPIDANMNYVGGFWYLLNPYALLALFSIQLALILLTFQLLAGLATPVLIRYASRKAGARLVSKHAMLSAVLVDGIQGMPDLLAFDAARRQAEVVANISSSIAAAQSQLGFLSSFESAAEKVLAHLASWMIMFMTIPLIRFGQIDGVYLGTLLLATLASFEAANPLPQAARTLESSLAATDRLEQVIAAQPEVRDPVTPLAVPHDISLQIKDLRFAYPPLDGADHDNERSSFALNGLNLDLPTGKRMAIIGPSGAGKTTLVNLLLRFWDYKEGQILIGNKDLSQYHQDEVRALIGVVSQRTYLFNATLRENLRLAQPEASLEEIFEVCKAAQIHDFIASLPEGYDTWIGEAGLRLSGGERQRLAIARTLLKDTPLLILDEPTANLDPLTERGLVQSLFSLAEGRTTLWITHRLLGMETMDEILVMNRGRIVERGGHIQLMDLDGMYRRMWDLQHQIV